MGLSVLTEDTDGSLNNSPEMKLKIKKISKFHFDDDDDVNDSQVRYIKKSFKERKKEMIENNEEIIIKIKPKKDIISRQKLKKYPHKSIKHFSDYN
jgi:hypothetical protein